MGSFYVRVAAECLQISTYGNDAREKHGVYEEVARLREARRLPLDGAAVLV